MWDATPLLRLYAHAALGRQVRLDPIAAQRRQLLRLVRHARHTAFGRAHGFDAIRTVADYQARVPLRDYDAFWREFWRPAFPHLAGVTWPDPAPFFAESSGTTTGTTKFIPVTLSMLAANRRAALATLVWHVHHHPRSRLMGGQNFLLGGSTDLRPLAPGLRAGDLSGIAAHTMPRFARTRSFPPRDLALIADWDEKLARLADAATGRDIRSISGTPSWLLLLFEALADRHPGRPSTLAPIFPNLELVVHGGTGFAPYAPRFAAWLEGTGAEMREVYPASEGFVALADRGPGEGLRVMPDNGLFLEFVPIEELGRAQPCRHWLGTAEPGAEYALALTTNAGLWSYLLGDRVRLLSRDPARLLVTGRLRHTLSLFGEHVSGEEMDRAIAAAAADTGCIASEYSAAPRFEGAKGRHVFVVEAEPAPDAPAFARALDAALLAANADYAAHRKRDVQLLPPTVRVVPGGSFAAWMRARGRLGGQNKVPRVLDDLETLEAIGRPG